MVKLRLSLKVHITLLFKRPVCTCQRGRWRERFEVTGEQIENKDAWPGYDDPFWFYRNDRGYISLKEKPQDGGTATPEDKDGEERQLPREAINPEESVLSQVRDPERYPILSHLADTYARFRLYPEIKDFEIDIGGGWVQLLMMEGRYSIPATRLSDGTLRYLCLLAILCHPDPPPLVCIEEPELGGQLAAFQRAKRILNEKL